MKTSRSINVLTILPVLILFFLLACNSKLEVSINTVTKFNVRSEIADKVIAKADALNSGITNIEAYIDTNNGQLVIEFDYPKQYWEYDPTIKPEKDKTNFHVAPISFLIRLFDKNGNNLSSFTTNEIFMPEIIYNQITNINPQYFTESYRVPTRPIFKINNKLIYPINSQIADYAKMVEFGWNTNNGLLKQNLFMIK